MADLIRQVAAQSINPALFLAGMAWIYASGLLLLAAAGLKFLEHARHPEPLATGRAHFFSTREMLIGVLVLFPFWLNSLAQLRPAGILQYLYSALGIALMTAAVIWHVWAKIAIRRMWSDGIEIKRSHTLMTTGPYALARHPMYASLLLWCWGASLAMLNWATLLITTAVLLPLMVKRARDEETELSNAAPDYLLYQRNVPMLTPRLGATPAMAVRIAAVVLFGYLIVAGLTLSGLLLIGGLHLYLSFCLVPAKVAFSYRSKAGLTVVVWALAQAWAPLYDLLYLLLAMFLYGLAFNCPCMILYERFHGCPCFGWVKACLARPHAGAALSKSNPAGDGSSGGI
ncbi:MAG: isoprenylcysteine carboxylmethyltransferase family protein [Alphaproteobacteria bacterium]|nr:isoprenylcysteine carboxylmethyltransferase family protein [Alphaproteobacteria bacterium]